MYRVNMKTSLLHPVLERVDGVSVAVSSLYANVKGVVVHCITRTMMTPTRSMSVAPVCPDAPARKRKTELFAEHCDLGILPGDFVKPDPAMTRREARIYLLEETRRWLTGRICDHADEIHEAYTEGIHIDLVSYLSGDWPAGRLYVLFRLLSRQPDLHPAVRTPEAFFYVGQWAANVCDKYLQGTLDDSDPATRLATGFVTTDCLPCGRPIESLWNHSPFEALRNAPPLTEGDVKDHVDDSNAPELFICLMLFAPFLIPLIASIITLTY